jgi:hypothetical protein
VRVIYSDNYSPPITKTNDYGFVVIDGDDAGAPPGTDPTSAAALFGQYVFVGSAGQVTGKADFTISGLGSASTADLYFRYGVAPKVLIPGTTNVTFAATGMFTPANTEFF